MVQALPQYSEQIEKLSLHVDVSIFYHLLSSSLKSTCIMTLAESVANEYWLKLNGICWVVLIAF